MSAPLCSGEKISLDFEDIPIRSVLQIIADIATLNLVISETVQGNITLRLKDIPWNQAMDLVSNAKGLGWFQDGNIIFIQPIEELNLQKMQHAQAEIVIKELNEMQAYNEIAELEREVIRERKKAELLAELEKLKARMTSRAADINETGEPCSNNLEPRKQPLQGVKEGVGTERFVKKAALITSLKPFLRDDTSLDSLLSNASRIPALSACKSPTGRRWHLKGVLQFLADEGDLKEEHLREFAKAGFEKILNTIKS